MKLVNLTPHAIVVRRSVAPGLEALQDLTIPPSGTVARVSMTPGRRLTDKVPFSDLYGMEVYSSPTYGEVEGLPTKETGTMCIVSSMVLERAPNDRDDLLAPGTGPADNPVRNEKGQIIAVTRLIYRG